MVALAAVLGLVWLVIAFVFWMLWLTERHKRRQALGIVSGRAR
jgi:hypothetical protein